MAELVLVSVVSNHGSCVAAANDHCGTLLDRLNGRVKEGLRSLGKCRELEDAWGSTQIDIRTELT